MDEQEGKARVLDIRDFIGLVGIALITGGTAMMHVPAALIVCGVLLLAGAILAARR